MRRKAFTLIEMLVVISIIALLIGILLPSLGAAKKNASRMENSTRIRGMHQGMATFANGNRDKMPGMTSNGGIVKNGSDPDTSETNDSGNGDSVQGRYAIMLRTKLFSPDYVISPLDTNREKWSPGTDFKTTVFQKNYSYALLSIKKDPGTSSQKWFRREEWGGGNVNAKAMMIADRNTGEGVKTDEDGNTSDLATSYHNGTEWEGSAVWNDNHITYEPNWYEIETRYGSGPEKISVDPDDLIGRDNIFEEDDWAAGGQGPNGANALMAGCFYSIADADTTNDPYAGGGDASDPVGHADECNEN